MSTLAEHAAASAAAATQPLGAAPLVISDRSGALVGRGRLRTWSSDRSDDVVWSQNLVRHLADRPGMRAIGAIGFAPSDPAVMHLPEELERFSFAELAEAGAGGAGRRPEVAPVVTERPYRQAYAEAVADVLPLLDGDLEKVVLGRRVVIDDLRLGAGEILGRLAAVHPGQHLFSVPVGTADQPAVLLGCSPELLLSRTGRRVRAFPLAGSVPRSNDPVEDRARADALLHSEKDRREHAHVVDWLVERLAPRCAELDAPATPELVATDTMWHLGTAINGLLDDGAPSALELAQAVHPTPAVGGVPLELARSAIAAAEREARGWFTGAVGWVDGTGDGAFAVTIRCGVLRGDELELFAGAGIVAGSDPQSETRETGAKLGTMLRAAGVDR